MKHRKKIQIKNKLTLLGIIQILRGNYKQEVRFFLKLSLKKCNLIKLIKIKLDYGTRSLFQCNYRRTFSSNILVIYPAEFLFLEFMKIGTIQFHEDNDTLTINLTITNSLSAKLL